jgi:hypothetical protein
MLVIRAKQDCRTRSGRCASKARWPDARGDGLRSREASCVDEHCGGDGHACLSSRIEAISIGGAVRELLPADLWRRARVEDATRNGLQWFVLPVWMAAGLADWWCHRRSDIEHTAGTRESAIHAAMMVEGGVPALLGLFCEVDAAMLAVTYGALALHEVSGLLDVAYADGRREVTPVEQYVHGFLGRVPMMAAFLLTVLHWDQARAVVGLGGRPDWRLKPKRRPLSRAYLVGNLATLGALVVLPYAEELARCVRASDANP